MTNNLWLVYRTDRVGYDEYDSFIVYSNSGEDARNRMPKWDETSEVVNWNKDSPSYSRSWTTRIENVEVTFLGFAAEEAEVGSVVIASFNAG